MPPQCFSTLNFENRNPQNPHLNGPGFILCWTLDFSIWLVSNWQFFTWFLIFCTSWSLKLNPQPQDMGTCWFLRLDHMVDYLSLIEKLDVLRKSSVAKEYWGGVVYARFRSFGSFSIKRTASQLKMRLIISSRVSNESIVAFATMPNIFHDCEWKHLIKWERKCPC